MTAVIYARYSSDNQREESIEGQIRECTAYAEKNGITIVKHYIDRAISAKTDNRPEFQQMIKDSDKKLFDIVLVCAWTDREHPERPLQRWPWNLWVHAGFRAEVPHRPSHLAFCAGIVQEVQ